MVVFEPSLVDPVNSFPSEAQRIDVATRTVTSQKIHAFATGRIITTRHDSVADKLLVAYLKSTGRSFFSTDPYPGYAISLLDYR